MASFRHREYRYEGWTNHLLESVTVPTIWISNSLGAIDHRVRIARPESANLFRYTPGKGVAVAHADAADTKSFWIDRRPRSAD